MNIALKVSNLFYNQSGAWNLPLLRLLFHHSEIDIITAIKPRIGYSDSHYWGGTKNGIYSVKTGYDMMFRKEKHDLLVSEECCPSRNPVLQEC